MTASVEEIAGKLTGAQRRLLHEFKPGVYLDMTERSSSHPLSFHASGRCLMRANLIEWHPNKRISDVRLTPLGIRVATHLKDTQP